MNILSVNKFYWKKGGSESVFFGEKEMLENGEHKVIPFSMEGPENEETPYSKYFVDNVDYSKPGIKNKLLSASKIIYSFDAKKKMHELLSNYSPDLAHFHIFQHQISPSVFGELKKRDIPILLTLHDLKPLCPNYKMYVNGHVCEECKGRKFYNCLKNRCTKGSTMGSLVNTIEMYFHYAMGFYQGIDRYIAVSKFYQNKMIEYGFPSEKITFLPNYINVSKYDQTIPEEGYILYFGRLSEEKGVSLLIEAAKITPEVKYYIVGSGPLETELKRKAEINELENISFFGYKSGNELMSILSGATCIIVPSLWYEAFGLVITEAFAAGKPVIGSDIGAIPELIEEGVDGFIFPPGDVVTLAEKITWIWNNRAAAKEMGLEGRKKVEEHYSAEAHYDGLISIYNSVLGL